TYQNVMFALDAFSNWTRDDRKGWSLREFVPETPFEMFAVDVELFPTDLENQRRLLVDRFEAFCMGNAVEVIDKCVDPNLVLYRVGVNAAMLGSLLEYRDVRKVDLPPAFSLP